MIVRPDNLATSHYHARPGPAAVPRSVAGPSSNELPSRSLQEPIVLNPRRIDAARTLAILAGAVLAAAPLSASAPARAQGAARQQATDAAPEQLLADFVHYVKIDQRELAESYGKALLELNLKPEQFLALVEDTPQAQTRFDEAVRDALRDARLEPIASELERLVEQGRLAQARDPGAIGRNIELLSGTLRARTLARQRLLEAKQYAVPQLLAAMTGAPDPSIALEARRLLIGLQADAVAPLVAALPRLGPAAQEQVSMVLGEIGYAEAAPYLAELARAPQVDGGVRAAANQALARTAGDATSTSTQDLFERLAERYYAEPGELTRFPREEHQLVWSYEPAIGLYPTPVRTEVFNEAMAMRLAEHALEIDAATEGAVPLWIAANFRRQIQTPEGYDNPMYSADRREAMYYAVAAGADAAQRVLGRALNDQDTPLALLAIQALSRTAGGASLWSGSVDDKPLLQALTYPDRRVQFAAAMVLGRARPSESFEGADRIVPILAGAVRDTGEKFAVVLGRSIDAEQRLADMLTERGFTVVGRGSTFEDVRAAIAEAPGIDLVALDLPRGATEDRVKAARADAKLRVTPILAVLPYDDFSALSSSPLAKMDLVRFARQGLNDEQLSNAIGSLLADAGWTDEEQTARDQRAVAALDVLRDIAAGSSALSVGDATSALLSALDTTSGGVRLVVADVLSRIGEPRAQRGLMDAAFSAEPGQNIALMDLVASSAKRFGPMLDDRQVSRLLELASAGDDDEAIAAASLVGSLNLPGQRVVPLLLGGR